MHRLACVIRMYYMFITIHATVDHADHHEKLELVNSRLSQRPHIRELKVILMSVLGPAQGEKLQMLLGWGQARALTPWAKARLRPEFLPVQGFNFNVVQN